ncbi:hypothetical protein EV586_10873 [Tumebacillus sp. BK434]|nr:hypothetical protein EV586_10873 [Tumebacillus sp. BK434]
MDLCAQYFITNIANMVIQKYRKRGILYFCR